MICVASSSPPLPSNLGVAFAELFEKLEIFLDINCPEVCHPYYNKRYSYTVHVEVSAESTKVMINSISCSTTLTFLIYMFLHTFDSFFFFFFFFF